MTSGAVPDHGEVDRMHTLPLRSLRCAEVWAGGERTASLVEMPGMVAWVHATLIVLERVAG